MYCKVKLDDKKYIEIKFFKNILDNFWYYEKSLEKGRKYNLR